jgi:hypothetical protein
VPSTVSRRAVIVDDYDGRPLTLSKDLAFLPASKGLTGYPDKPSLNFRKQFTTSSPPAQEGILQNRIRGAMWNFDILSGLRGMVADGERGDDGP